MFQLFLSQQNGCSCLGHSQGLAYYSQGICVMGLYVFISKLIHRHCVIVLLVYDGSGKLLTSGGYFQHVLVKHKVTTCHL